MSKAIVILSFLFLFLSDSCHLFPESGKINRYNLVTRHNLRHTEIHPLAALTVGNGEFAYTADITGMQSYPEYYESGIPLGTQSQWGWHSFPNPENYSLDDVYKVYRADHDSIPYPYQYTNDPDPRRNEASLWLRENPHRLHLGLIGLQILKDDSSFCTISDIQLPVQQLNLWTGELKSCFLVDGKPVEVITYCHQEIDMVSFRIVSELLSSGRIRCTIRFPYAPHEKFSPGYDLDSPDKHTTVYIQETKTSARFERKLDDTLYFVKIRWKEGATPEKIREHEYAIVPSHFSSVFELNCHFSPEPSDASLPSFSKTSKNNTTCWKKFWESGAAVDFSRCSDPRAAELERRVVLSQYLTKIQCSGSLPPQETGLTYNSWYGKFHLEMHWWHAAHFILWGRPELIKQQMNFYFQIFDEARHTAHLQKYNGIRWPKMVGPDGRESPSTIGPFLIWQQPHIIYLAELLYLYSDSRNAVLDTYKELIFATADFMASYARYDSTQKRYILGPPLIPAQECFNSETTLNPVFELEYWHWGLGAAQKWRQRLGMEPDPYWQEIINHLSVLPVKDDLYLFAENATDSYSNPNYLTDHPIVLGIAGFLPWTERIDTTLMENTLHEAIQNWEWETVWGWDFPLAAMNAVSLGLPELAIDLLLMDSPKNRYLMNGHNYQGQNLTLYLPGNGALLTAVAMMCTYANGKNESSFPSNGKWNVKYEKLHCLY